MYFKIKVCSVVSRATKRPHEGRFNIERIDIGISNLSASVAVTRSRSGEKQGGKPDSGDSARC